MRTTARSLRRVLREPRYTILAFCTSLVLVTAVLWWQNWSLIVTMLTLSEPTVSMKIAFLLSLYVGLGTNFTMLSALTLLATTVLFGIQVALLTYFIRRSVQGQRRLSRLHGFGISGLLASTLGIGCAACGSLILTSTVASLGGAVFLAALPLHGLEFGLLGLCLLGYATVLLAQKIDTPAVCDV